MNLMPSTPDAKALNTVAVPEFGAKRDQGETMQLVTLGLSRAKVHMRRETAPANA